MSLRTLTRRFPTAAERYWLTHDETVVVVVRGEDESYRVRIWRSKFRPAVVVVSSSPGGRPPSHATVPLANALFAGWLKFWPHGMYYFEHSRKGYGFVNFVGWGYKDRMRLVEPKFEATQRQVIEDILGQPIEDDLGEAA